jgi:hypothetical protein
MFSYWPAFSSVRVFFPHSAKRLLGGASKYDISMLKQTLSHVDLNGSADTRKVRCNSVLIGDGAVQESAKLAC